MEQIKAEVYQMYIDMRCFGEGYEEFYERVSTQDGVKFIRGKVEIEPIIAFVDEEVCSGCGLCAKVCPFGALTLDGKERLMLVNRALCKGCGACAVACPSSAISLSHFTPRQILEEVEALTY
jgi:heterodisulfide reductase subunit A